MATHLNPSPAQLSDIYGGREHVKDLAGWEGDTTRNADGNPSIGEDDYKADLDSVNIIGRMKKGQSYVEAMSAYYHDVNQGKSVREKEFLKNKNWKQVKNTIYDSLIPNEIYREIMTPYYKDLFQKNSIQDRDFIKNEEWKYTKNAVYDDILPEDIKRKRAEAAKNYILKEFPVQGKNILKFLERLEAVAEK